MQASDVALLQRAIGNHAVSTLLGGEITPLTVATLQRAHWEWDGSKWKPVGGPSTPRPSYSGKRIGQTAGEELDAPTVDDSDAYDEAETLADKTTIDWPAIVTVMSGVEIGTQVAPSVWRKMREDLSNAIALPNKSHPAHGSNFNKKQRPEQQISDWATPIVGKLKEKLAAYFLAKHGIYI